LDERGLLEKLVYRVLHELQPLSLSGVEVFGGFPKLHTVVIQQETLRDLAAKGCAACAALHKLLVDATSGIPALAGCHWELRVADVTQETETSSCHTDGSRVSVAEDGDVGCALERAKYLFV
jgi:hypothetical protein